jgi:transposase
MRTYVERLLAPVLGPEHIVVMDNLSSHKHAEVIASIEPTGAQVWFLPRYSPDFNPIERMWSKVKAYLRKVAARTKEDLIATIGEALATITSQDAQNWTKHAGYASANTES